MFTRRFPALSRAGTAFASGAPVQNPTDMSSLEERSGGLPLHHRLSQLLPQLAREDSAPKDPAEHWAGHFGLSWPALLQWRSTVERHNHAIEDGWKNGSAHRTRAAVGVSVRDLGAIVSPFVTVGNGPLGPTLVTRRPVEAGTYLLSLPASSSLAATPPSAVVDQAASVLKVKPEGEGYAALQLALTVEELAAQLLVALADSGNPLHSYAQMLYEREPAKNLPYLERRSVVAEGSSESESIAGVLWDFFSNEWHNPACPALEGVEPDMLRWAVSTVLSRRIGPSALLPLIDMLNHDPEPNAACTMACDPSTAQELEEARIAEAPNRKNLVHDMLTGVDVLDNLMAGVPTQDILEPYAHVFAIASLPEAGTPLTLGYSFPQTIRKKQPQIDGEEAAMWLAQWGFVPERHLMTQSLHQDLVQVVVRNRVFNRSKLFPIAPA